MYLCITSYTSSGFEASSCGCFSFSSFTLLVAACSSAFIPVSTPWRYLCMSSQLFKQGMGLCPHW